MAERLTKKISKTIQDKFSLGSYLYYDFAEIDDTNKLLNKLGKLEDILEKHGIESVEELESILINGLAMLDIQKINILKEMELKTDRDTWKRACELACEDLQFHDYGNEKTEDGIIMKVDYFYQQAKKEGEQEEV